MTTDDEFMAMLKSSITLGINPLEAVIEAYQLQKEYKTEYHHYCKTNGEPTEFSDDLIKQYVIKGMAEWYNLRRKDE